MNITLDHQTAQTVQHRVTTGGYQSPEAVVFKAIEVLEQLETLMSQQIEVGIQRGLEDVRAGRTTTLPSSGSLDSFVDSILD